jgi:uncharacterized protein (DUF2147 family)
MKRNKRKYIMKKTILILTLLLSGFAIHSQSESDRIHGVWLNHLENVKVEILQRDGKFFGKIVWIDIPEDVDINFPTDKNNPDPKLRSRKIMGLEMMTDLKYANGIWEDGKLYSPKKGQTVDCKLEISDDNQTMYVTASKGWFSKTLEWTRVND